MQQHSGTLKCLALAAPICSAVTDCVIDFDDSTVVLHLPEAWHTVLQEGEIRFCCPSCWKALEHEKDLSIPCPKCLAETGEPCRGLYHDDGTRAPELVCFGRRVKRLCIDRRPDLLDPLS